MPVARYSACEVAWHRWEKPVLVVAVCGVVPVAAILPVFPARTNRHYKTTASVHIVCPIFIASFLRLWFDLGQVEEEPVSLKLWTLMRMRPELDEQNHREGNRR